MGLLSFIKGVGEKIFKKEDASGAEVPENPEPLRASALLAHVQSLGLSYTSLSIKTSGHSVILEGQTNCQQDSEKIALAVGNVEGVEIVDNLIVVTDSQPQSRFHTVGKGDTLSKIAKEYYGDMMKYPIIFEANRPMLKDPDLIYPGQVLRIPAI